MNLLTLSTTYVMHILYGNAAELNKFFSVTLTSLHISLLSYLNKFASKETNLLNMITLVGRCEVS